MNRTSLSSGRLARAGLALVFTIMLCTLVGLGWLQPGVAEAETLQAGPTTAITPTSTKNWTAQYVIMSRITVSSTGAGDGLVTLASLTVQNQGSAPVAVGRVYISSNVTATTLSNALEIGRTKGLWTAGTTTGIVFTAGTPTQRSINTGTPKSLLIVFDLSTAGTGTTRASVTTINVVNGADVPATGLTSLSNEITVAAGGQWAAVTLCTDCHGLTLLDNTTRSAATGSFVGSHNKHVDSRQLICASCHVYPASTASTDHRNGYINMAGTFSYQGAAGNYYSKASGPTYSFLQSSAATSATAGTCSNLYCHSNAIGTSFATPTWGKPATGACGTCHGVNGILPASYPASTRHAQHVGSAQGYKYACAQCHVNVVTVTSDATVTPQISGSTNTLHVNNTHNINFDSFNPTGTYSLGTQQCTNLYCHSRGTSAVTSQPSATAAWGITLNCSGCHGAGTTQTTLLTTNAHSAHINDGVKNKIGRSIGCRECHNATASTDTTIGSAGNHVNKLLNIKFDNSSLLPNSDGPLYNGVSTTLAPTGATKTPGAAGYTCSNVYCHSSGNLFSASGTGTIVSSGAAPTFMSPAWNGAVLSCDACHGNQGGGRAHPVYATGSAGSTTANSHVNHVESSGISCDACHVNTTVSTATAVATMTIVPGGSHLNRIENVNFNTAKTGPSATWVFASKTCNTSYCHGGSSGAWGANTNNATCVKCHGVPGATPAQYTAETRIAAPGFVSTAPVGTGLSTAGAFTYTDAKVGAHDVHLRSVDGMSPPVACTECHSNVLTTSASFTGHMNGTGNLDWGPLALTGGSTPTYVGGNCTSNYCHTAFRAPGAGAGQGGLNNPFTWNTNTIVGTSIANSCTNKCHAMPPGFGVSGDTHQTITVVGSAFTTTVLNQCSSSGTGCHPTITAGGASLAALFTNGGRSHVNGTVEGGTCDGCHGSVISAPVASALSGGTVTNRMNVRSEFTNSWSHKRSAVPSGTVTQSDCIVCHVEGDMATASTTTWHKNGRIDLRDPDTGTSILGVASFSAASGTNNPGSYVNSATSTSFIRFSRNLNVRLEDDPNFLTIASIQMNHCLKCHDANGATSTLAQVPGGSAAKPFATTITAGTSTWYRGIYTAGSVSGGLVNLARQFATTNASYHPVAGKANNSYAKTVMMITPWRAPTSQGTLTSWGYLISCWDCHALPTNSGTINRQVTSHGSRTTLRGTIRTAGTTSLTNLCVRCHITTYSTTGTNHPAGSAFQGGNSNMDAATFGNCAFCHAYSPAGSTTGNHASTLRPIRGEDAHGFNDRTIGVVGSRWVNGASSHRPYAFIRNTLVYWSPTSVSTTGETLQRSRGCTGFGSAICGSNMNASSSYNIGGVY